LEGSDKLLNIESPSHISRDITSLECGVPIWVRSDQRQEDTGYDEP